jgi:hypothetical protein
VLLATELLTPEERTAALDAIPWRDDVRELTLKVLNTMENRTIDLIDVAIGPDSHGRAAIVAAFEGLDALQQATMDLSESVARRAYLSRVEVVDPLGEGAPLPESVREKYRRRQARLSIEDAAVRTASASDHLANAYLRLAWEANIASAPEVMACGFDPTEPEPESWTSVPKCKAGLDSLDQRPLALLPSFRLTPRFRRYASATKVRSVRRLRDEVVHRARPAYRESVPFGRTSLWAQGEFSFNIEDTEQPLEDPSFPSFEERREEIGAAIREGVAFGEELWEVTRQWLGTVGITVRHVSGYVTEISTTLHHDVPVPKYPRGQRDPAPFVTETQA